VSDFDIEWLKIKMPDSWRASKGAISVTSRPQLLSPRGLQRDPDEAPEGQSSESRSKSTTTTPRGLVLYIDPETPWKAVANTPWARIELTSEVLACYADVVMIGGPMSEVRALVGGILRRSESVRKRSPVLMRRLNLREEDDDLKELAAMAGVVHGFLVPPYGSQDMAVSYERTRRRVSALVQGSLEAGWTLAPKIALDAPGIAWVDRLSKGIAEYLVVRDPPQGMVFPTENVIVPVKRGDMPWWRTTANYLYTPISNELWYDTWQQNPLTVSVFTE